MGLFQSKAGRWFETGKKMLYWQDNVREGIALLEQAAEREFVPAMLMLAEIYHTGEIRNGSEKPISIVPQNEARALELYQKMPDCPPVLLRKAEIFFHGNGVPRDDEMALKLFREIQSRADEKEDRKLFDLLGIMRLWRDDISAEALARDAEAYIAALQFWGRGGLEKDTEKSYDTLSRYISSHEEPNTVDADLYFCYDALQYRRKGQAFLMNMGQLGRLAYGVCQKTTDAEIKHILKEEMLVPPLKKMFAEAIREGILSRAKDCVSMMVSVCKEDGALRTQLDHFLFGILEKETNRLAANEDYETLIELLEQCSTDFDSIRISCHLIAFYLSHNVVVTRTREGKEEKTTIKFDDSAHKVLFRLCEQLERLQKGNTNLKEKFDCASGVKTFLYAYDIELDKLSQDALSNLYRLSNIILDEWREYANHKERSEEI